MCREELVSRCAESTTYYLCTYALSSASWWTARRCRGAVQLRLLVFLLATWVAEGRRLEIIALVISSHYL